MFTRISKNVGANRVGKNARPAPEFTVLSRGEALRLVLTQPGYLQRFAVINGVTTGDGTLTQIQRQQDRAVSVTSTVNIYYY